MVVYSAGRIKVAHCLHSGARASANYDAQLRIVAPAK